MRCRFSPGMGARWGLGGLAAVLAALFFPHIAFPVSTGIDPSYAFAFSALLDRGIAFGREVVFTYGPLGFLVFPRPVGGLHAIATIALTLMTFGFAGALVAYHAAFQEAEDGRWVRGVAWAAAGGTMFLAGTLYSPAFNNYALFLTVMALMAAHHTGRLAFVWAAATLAAAALLAKASLGLFCVAPVGMYGAYALWRERRWAPAVIAGVGVPALVMLGWVALYGGLDGLGTYARAAWEFSRGYPSAMADGGSLNWPLLGLFLAATLALPIYLKSPRVAFLYLIFAPTALGLWKYGTMQLGHWHHFVIGMALFFGMVAPHVRRPKAVVAWGLIGVALGALGANAAVSGVNFPPFGEELAIRLRWPGYRFVSQIVKFGAYTDGLRRLSVERTAAARLPAEALAVIGRAPVDFFPWELTYAHANELNWRPHPTLQAYTAYTPWLDRLDAAFYAGPRSPAFVLWHETHPGDAMGGVGDRYVLNDEPQALLSLLTRYEPRERHGSAILFARAAAPVFGSPVQTPGVVAKWDTWLEVPTADSATIVRALVAIERPPLGAWRAWLHGEPLYYVDYQLATGRTIERRLAPLNAASGTWVSPHVSGLDAAGRRFVGERVVRVRFRCTDPGVSPGVALGWERIRRQDGEPVATGG